MAGFFNALFGRKSGEAGPREDGTALDRPGAPAATAEHKGFTIRAEPYPAARGQYQVAGTIVHVTRAGATREHRFIRADVYGTADLAAQTAPAKGQLIIDEQGEGMFG